MSFVISINLVSFMQGRDPTKFNKVAQKMGIRYVSQCTKNRSVPCRILPYLVHYPFGWYKMYKHVSLIGLSIRDKRVVYF